MGEVTKISWRDHTFNPWSGCTKVSEGCRNCYAEREARRFPKLKERVRSVEVTSFQPADGDRPAYVVACTHKQSKKADEGYEPRKVARVFKITHADITAYHKAIRDFKKAASEKQPAEASS